MNYFLIIVITVLGIVFGYKIGIMEATKDSPKKTLKKASEAVKSRREKSKEKIIDLLEKQGSIANDDVEELIGVSDATATRYLSELEAEGRLRQSGGGRSIKYTLV